MDVRFRPISTWPGERTPAHKQRSGEKIFAVDYAKTLNSLDRELRYIKARDVVIEADLREDQIRLDGWPRGREYPKTSGVIVSFTGEHGPLRIPCDYFKRYEHNLRAIALHLERLRLATNYGVGAHGEQYKGWRQIAAPGVEPSLTVETAAIFVVIQAYGDQDEQENSAEIIRSADGYRTAYRDAAAKLHPDAGGHPEQWLVLQHAKVILDEHHGLAKAEGRSS